MLSLKKTPKKLIAVLLALVLVISAIPVSVSNAFAQQVDKFTVVIESYDKTATVTLTQSDDSTVTETVTAENGEAVFENFYDDEKLYNLVITDLIGYEDYSSTVPAVQNEISIPISELTEIETAVVSGIVTDKAVPVENTLITYSAYNGQIRNDVKTNADGEYSFEVYKNIEYSVTINAGDKYESPTKTICVTDNETVNIQLVVNQFPIHISVGENGTVSDNNIFVEYGEDMPSTIVKADENYLIDKLYIDGTEIKDASAKSEFDISAELKNIKENHNVSVTFYRPTYEITINYNSNGEVKDNSDNPVSNGGKIILEQGSAAGFTAVPAEHYHIGNVSIDGEDVKASWSNDYGNYSHTFNDNKKHSVTISFAINTYKVNVSAKDNNGTISANETIVDWNNESLISITPNPGFDIDTFSVSSDSSVNTGSLAEDDYGIYTYLLTNITGNVNVEVSFREIEENIVEDKLNNEIYNITFSKEPVVIGNDYIVAEGETITISPNAASPYIRVKVNDGIESKRGSSVSFSDDKKIKTIYVSEKKISGWNHSVNVGIHFKIDREAPVISNVRKNPNTDFNNHSYVITADVTDNLAGVDKVFYSTNQDLSNESEAKFDGKTVELTTTENEYNGFYYIWAVDKVGNISNIEKIEIAIDNTKPTVDKFEFVSDSLNPCAFGTFSNSDITVVITASDSKSSTTNSGVKEITFNGETKPVNDGKATFTLSASDFALPKAVSATAVDAAGNSSDITVPDHTNSNIINNEITISSVVPTIDIQKSAQQPQYDNGSEIWFNGDNAFEVKIDDEFGIKNVVVTMNGKEVVNDVFDRENTAITSKSYTINTLENSKDGENIVEVSVINVTGNSSKDSDVVYIDTTKPDVTGFEFKSSGTSVLAKVLNFLTFGNFFNEKIEIKVSAKDDNASSGLKEITLYGNEIELDTQPVVDGAATFVIPAEDITDEMMHFDKEISAKAKDNVDNQTADFVYPTTTNSDTFSNSGLMIETVKPTIHVTFEAPASEKNAATADSNDWYSSDIDFNIEIQDTDSGIRKVDVDINGTPVLEDKDDKNIAEAFNESQTKTTDLSFRVNTDQAQMNDDGSYTITVSVTDNAGNVSETYTKTIYKDTDNPFVTDFKFAAAGYHNDDKVDKNHGANQSPVKETSYGYYFIENTIVTITAHDAAPTSGVKSITYYTVDKNGGKSEETTKLVDENNKITFTIPANFKGQIYAKAADNVDNTPDEFVNPNSTIVESPDQHTKTSSIKYTLKNTAYKDSEGNNLYADSTAVDVEIIDSYSGIRQIDWEIVSPYDNKNQAGTVTVANDAKVTSTAKPGCNADCLGDWKTATEDNLVTVLKNTITVSNNSNNIQIKFTLTDRAGNVTKDVVQTLSIDKTAPKIVVQMNENDDAAFSGFFKVDRTADVYVYERNFKSDDFNFTVSRIDDNNSKSNIDITPKFTKVSETVVDGVECYVYKMSCKFTADGDYSFAVNAKDYVGNSINDNGVRYSDKKTIDYSVQNNADKAIDNQFTIDHTNPIVQVTYDNNNVTNFKYYNAYRTATITVTEHNFTSADNRIVYTRTSARDGQAIETPSVSSWSQNGNVYTATIRYAADGDYTFGMDITDKAGNITKDESVSYPNGRDTSKNFTIDTTISKPIIGGVENGMSYKDEVIPTILIDDVNYASSTVELLRTRKDEINLNVTDKYIVNMPGNRNTVSEDTFEKVQENDGIYTLNVSVTDLAGNTASDSVTFTVNRFGSVYEFSSDLVQLNNAYVKSVTGNIVITEYNPDKLVANSLKVQITRDGAPINDVKYTVNPAVNNTVAIGSSGWYQYDYTFDHSNFADDGVYTITVASEDTVGNKPQSSNDSDLMFRVDSTPPEVVSIKGLESKIVNDTDQSVEYQVMDAIGLKSIVVSIDNVSQNPITEFENVSNYSGSFTIPEGLEHNVKIVITDLAGNVTDTSSDTFEPTFEFNNVITVSTNVFVRWYANKPLFIGSIAGTAAAAGLIIFLVARRKKKSNEEDNGVNA